MGQSWGCCAKTLPYLHMSGFQYKGHIYFPCTCLFGCHLSELNVFFQDDGLLVIWQQVILKNVKLIITMNIITIIQQQTK